MRVFFAIKPDDAALEQLTYFAHHLATTYGGKYVKKTNIHLTLAFLGEIAIDQLAILRHIMSNVTAQAFYFSISKIGYWKQNQIIFAETSSCAPELMVLVRNLRRILFVNGYTFDSRTYKPHITLVRKAKSDQCLFNLGTPIRWQVTEWMLIQSKKTDHSVNYIALDRWPLDQISSQTLSV